MKIALCVSVPNNGGKLLALLSQSAALMQSGENDIVLNFTCHDEEQQAMLTQLASSAIEVEKSYVVNREPPKFYHANSVTHSRCINTMFRGADCDLTVICDYDAAFVRPDWDLLFVDQIVNKGMAFFGAPYGSDDGRRLSLFGGTVKTRKYQGKPNCILIGFETQRIRRLSNQICNFESEFGTSDALPIQLISNQQQSMQFGLPIGSFAHIDTGTLVTELIRDHSLPCSVLERRDSNYQTINVPTEIDQLPLNMRPEEYFFEDKPFFTHFRKGSAKLNESDTPGNYTMSQFAEDIEAYIRLSA